MTVLWPLNNPDAAAKSGGADYFSAGFISRAADPFGEAMTVRAYVRLNDGVDNAPSSLLNFDTKGFTVLSVGRITRRREREYGVMQGQAWQVKVYTGGTGGLLLYDLAGCWCCIEAGFEAGDEWQVMAQGKISGVTFDTNDTATIEVYDSIMELLNFELPREYYFDNVGHVGEVHPVNVSTDSDGFDNDLGIQYTAYGATYFTDKKQTIVFTSPTSYTLTIEGVGDLYGTTTTDLEYGDGPVIWTVPAEGWDGTYATGDTFEFYTTQARNVHNLTPIILIQSLVEDIVGVQVYDVINGAYYSDPFWDAVAWGLATAATFESINSGQDNTYTLRGHWPAGTRVMRMIQDALKLVNGSIYSTPTGQLGIWLLRPSTGATVDLNGRVGDGYIEILGAAISDTLDYTVNSVRFEYLNGVGEDAYYATEDSDPSINETRSATISSGWRVRGEVAQSGANIFLNRFKDARREYTVNTTLAGVLADVALGISVNEPDLGLTAETTDVTEINMDLLGHTAQIKAHIDPVSLANYCHIDSGQIDVDRIW